MKILSWNVRGLNAPNKQRVIKRRILLVSADIIFLQETKLGSIQVVAFGSGISSLFYTSSQVTVDSEGASGGLMIILNPSQVKVDGIASNRNWILAKVFHLQSNTTFFVINTYGPVSPLKKWLLWSSLDEVLSSLTKEQLFIGGDFNAIRRASDKRGGLICLGGSQQDFNDSIDRNGLMEIDSGDLFTWTNRRKGFSNIAEKIDRFFWQGDLRHFPFSPSCSIIPYSGIRSLSHIALLAWQQGKLQRPIQVWEHVDEGPKISHFDRKLVEEASIEGSKLFCFTAKLKIVK